MITNFSTSSVRTGIKRKRFWDQSTVVNSFFSIATTTVGAGGQASITFSNIPQTYTHLQVRAFGRYNNAGTSSEAVNMRFNNDSTYTNYRTHILYAPGSGTALSLTDQTTTYAGVSLADFWQGGVTSNSFGVIIYDILDYTNTNKNTTVRFLNGFDRNGGGNTRLGSGVWLNTAAITTITFTPANGLSFGQYTQFALYGVLA